MFKKRSKEKASVPSKRSSGSKKTATTKAKPASKRPASGKKAAKKKPASKSRRPQKAAASKKKASAAKKGVKSKIRTSVKPKASAKTKVAAKKTGKAAASKKKASATKKSTKTAAKPKASAKTRAPAVKKAASSKSKGRAQAVKQQRAATSKKKAPVRPPFVAYKGIRPYLFTSYAHKNMKEVFQIIKKLNRSRYRIWYDEGIEPGNEWPEVVGSAVINCSQFLVFMSPHAAESRNVRNEINLAFSENKDILVIFLKRTNLTEGMKLQIGTVQFINRFNLTEREFFDKLTKVLPSTLRS